MSRKSVLVIICLISTLYCRPIIDDYEDDYVIGSENSDDFQYNIDLDKRANIIDEKLSVKICINKK